jgi:hypothetical protein
MKEDNMLRHQLIESDIRYGAFQKVIRFINYEMVEGDVFEFGVYTGRSLALLQIANEEYLKNSIHKVDFSRDFFGFDSFMGMFKTNHPRWKDGSFSVNHSWHPTIRVGEQITKNKVIEFFDVLELKPPVLVEGDFEKSKKVFFGSYSKKAALIHIDCDTYENTKVVLANIKDTLQEGTILMFDDWFNYKGNPRMGEARAFNEFRNDLGKFSFVEYFDYGTFCKAFISVQEQ